MNKQPEAADVELRVIGALLDAGSPILRNSASDLISSSGLDGEDFTSPGRQAAFLAIKSLADRSRPTDAASVGAICGSFTGAPDFETLAPIQAANNCNRESFLSQVEVLKALSLNRKIMAFYGQEMALLTTNASETVNRVQALQSFAGGLAGAIVSDETGVADVYELAEDWDAFVRGEREPYVSTGVGILDETIQGFVPNLNVIGGMPGMGKSALVGEVVMSCLERGLRVGFFGLEDATKWISKRHLARALNIPVGSVAASRLNDYQQERLQIAMNNFANLFKDMHVYRRAGIDPVTLVQICKKWVLSKGVKIIFVDHGGEVQHEAHVRDRHDLAVANTYRQLRDLAVNHRIPIVVLCHFNRDTEKHQAGVPTMQSFAETEYIARMARLALGLWQKPGDNRLRCTVLKRTEGKRGETVAIERDEKFALVKRVGGQLLDLESEREAETKRESMNGRRSGAGGFSFKGSKRFGGEELDADS